MEDLSGETRRILSLFESSRKSLKRAFPLYPPQLHNYCALLAAMQDRELDTENMQLVSRYIREKMGVLSSYGGVPLIALSTGLSAAPDWEESFSRAQRLYKAMKNAGFPGTHHIVNTAFTLYRQIPRGSEEEFSQKARRMFYSIKQLCPALSFAEDGAAAALLAADEREPAAMELRLQTLTPLLTHAGVAQQTAWRISRVMALAAGDEAVAVERYSALIPALKARSFPLTMGAEPLAGGMLAAMDAELQETVETAAMLFGMMETLRGYAESRLGQVQRALCAAALAAMSLRVGRLTGHDQQMAQAVTLILGNTAITNMNAEMSNHNGTYDSEG